MTGALFASRSATPGSINGLLYGLAVWTASYLGWLPGSRLLRPPTAHSWRRNALMLLAHAVWGIMLALTLREIDAAERGAFSRKSGPLPDTVDPVPQRRGQALVD